MVDVLGEDLQCKNMEESLKSCLLANAPLLYRTACRAPFYVLKYAMTLDGQYREKLLQVVGMHHG
ncbi:hypothetical protein ACS0TY_004063 [Phlomoides rotata]